MRYDQLVLNAQVTIPNPVGGNVVFPSAPATTGAPNFSLGFGQNPVIQNGRAGHLNIPPNGGAQIINLISCAAVIYIYTNAMGAIQNVVLYHSHTGMIPAGNLPTHVLHNINGVPAGQIHVVFASSQSMTPNPNEGIQTAASGLIDMLNAGVPAGNIRVLTGTSNFGANGTGEVGIAPVAAWRNGNLQTTIDNVATQALAAYAAQFPPGQTKLGIMGSSHNLANGQTRIQTLRNANNNAQRDGDRLTALQTFSQRCSQLQAGIAQAVCSPAA